jgi:hypothetical protein
MVPMSELARRSDIALSRVIEITTGMSEPTQFELHTMADALGITARDLLGAVSDAVDGVVVRRRDDTRSWPFPDADQPWCIVRELAANRLHPWARGLELIVLTSLQGHRPVSLEEHQYMFHLRGGPVRLKWMDSSNEGQVDLQVDDSCYLAPGTQFQLGLLNEEKAALLIQRIPGRLSVESRYALGSIEPGARARVCGETMQWYTE